MLGFSVRTTRRGPLFNGMARRAADDFADAWEEEMAEYALDHIRRTYHTPFRHPTGYYESHVRITNASLGPKVWDGGLSGPKYGPWLEGLGSRNATTRFKGYHAFRNAARAVQVRAERMGERLLHRRYLRRMN